MFCSACSGVCLRLSASSTSSLMIVLYSVLCGTLGRANRFGWRPIRRTRRCCSCRLQTRRSPAVTTAKGIRVGHALKHRSLRAADEGEEIIGAVRVFAVAGDIEHGRAGNAASFQLFMAFRIRNECAAVIHIHLKGIVDVGAKQFPSTRKVCFPARKGSVGSRYLPAEPNLATFSTPNFSRYITAYFKAMRLPSLSGDAGFPFHRTSRRPAPPQSCLYNKQRENPDSPSRQSFHPD